MWIWLNKSKLVTYIDVIHKVVSKCDNIFMCAFRSDTVGRRIATGVHCVTKDREDHKTRHDKSCHNNKRLDYHCRVQCRVRYNAIFFSSVAKSGFFITSIFLSVAKLEFYNALIIKFQIILYKSAVPYYREFWHLQIFKNYLNNEEPRCQCLKSKHFRHVISVGDALRAHNHSVPCIGFPSWGCLPDLVQQTLVVKEKSIKKGVYQCRYPKIEVGRVLPDLFHDTWILPNR